MKALSTREAYGEGVQDGVLFTTYALVLALNDLYGWNDEALKAAEATAEIVNGYAQQSERGNGMQLIEAELKERGVKPFILSTRKGAK